MELLINTVKLSNESIIRLLFTTKIIWGDKESVLYFLIYNIFDSIPIIITEEFFNNSTLRKLQVELPITKPISTSATTTTSTNTNIDYSIPINELIKAVENIKDIYLQDRIQLKTIIQNFNTII